MRIVAFRWRRQMMDSAALRTWIQPHHLDEPKLNEYRESFQSHPARLVLLRDFLAESMADKLHRFLTQEAQFEKEYGLFSEEGAVDRESWEAADQDDRFFRLAKLAGTAPQYQMSPNALTYVRFRQAFQRPEFEAFFEAVSGLSLASSDDFGIHSMTVGDFLLDHSDDNKNRRLALVIYLSREWKPEYGGQLHMYDQEGNETVVPIEFNSVVVFDVLAETRHRVAPVEAVAGDNARLTIGGWYHHGD
jgi:Rps23 Pro-64 3,4-dihydroxylase Tpa1-like proline 4-hydroxylase